MPKKKPTAGQKREAAMERLGNSVTGTPAYGVPASSSFVVSNLRSYGARQDHKLPTVRIDQALNDELAAYGNAHQLPISETVRTMLRAGLEHQHCSKEEP